MAALEREEEPHHCVHCKGAEPDVPTSRRKDGPRMKTEKTELEGTFWVFAWPKLIPWHHKVVCLFCLPGGRDLWAIDEHGQLLIIENKTIKGIRGGDDPFNGMPVSSTVTGLEILERRWRQRLNDEREFRRKYPNGLGKEFPSGRCPGLLDSSLGRYACRRYPHVYREQIAPKIDSGEYEERAKRHLQMYGARLESPHYFALFTLFDGDEPMLKNSNYYDRLVSAVGKEHVHMFAVQRSPECYYPNACQIRSYRVRLGEG